MFKKTLKLNDYSPKSEIEKAGIELFQILSEYSECYFVGGYPRDLLFAKILNKKNTITDIDIAIKYNNKDIKEFFDSKNLEYKTLNEVFGVYSVDFKGFNFQIATYRKDGKISDGRRPSSVRFLKSIKQDSKRRDFTINAIYFNPIHKIMYDFNNGIKDLKKERIRFIGKTEKRIKEDYLRILRYVRFKNKYNLNSLDKDIFLIKKHVANLDNISKERIKIELDEILSLNNINTVFYELDKIKILDVLLPELKKLQGVVYKVNDNYNFDIYAFTLNCIKSFSNKTSFNVLKKYLAKDFLDLQNFKDLKEFIINKYGLGLVWASVFHELGKINPEYIEDNENKKIVFNDHESISLSLSMDIMRRYGFSKDLKEEISWLITNHDSKIKDFLDLDIINKKRFVFNENFVKIIILNIISLVAEYDDEAIVESELDKKFKDLIFLYNESIEEKKKILEIANNEVLKEFGLSDGQIYFQIINEITNLYIEGKIKTTSGVIKYLENKTGKIYSK